MPSPRRPVPRPAALAPGLVLPALAAAQPLQYTDRSAQFASPRWEGGRSVLKISDLNLDGHPDIVSVGDHGSPFIQSDLHGISVWLGDGAGSFVSRQTGDFGYGGVDVGDVDGDGLPDVAYGIHHNYSGTDLGDQVLEVALGDGTGVRWAPWDDGLGQQGQTWGMFGCALADFDHDGLLDLASNAFGCCDGIHAYLNNGDGTWAATLTRLGGNSDMDIQAADFNNDGNADFVTSSQQGSVWLGDGMGGFTSGDAGLPPGSTLLGRIGASAGDIDRDGRDDLAFCGASGGVQVWRSTPGGWVNAGAGLPTTPQYYRTAIADMDGDGHADAVAFKAGTIEVYRGDGAGSWTSAAAIPLPAPGNYSALVVGDVDHNGRPDIAAVVRRSTGTFTSRNFMHLWTESSAPPGLSMRITSPPPRRVWHAGSVQFIDWLAAGVGLVDLSISRDGSNGPWIPVASFQANDGRHQAVADPSWSGTNVYLRVEISRGPAGAHDTVGPLTILGGGCYPDCDTSTGRGVLDIFDFLCFQNRYDQRDPYACGCDTSTGGGVCDIFDFLCFQNAYAAGCP